MRLPFSYKTQIFGPLFMTSLLGHVLILGAGSFPFTGPGYGVQKAPSSMEVVILKEKDEVRERPPENEFLLTSDSAEEVAIHETQKKQPERKKAKESVVIRSEKGTLSEFDPVYLQNPAPVYPALARERGWQGLVLLRVSVNEKGRVEEIHISESSGHSLLDAAALKAVKDWNFLPARVGQLGFSSQIKIPIRFLLIEES